MSPLRAALSLLWRAERRALLSGLLLSVVVLAAGAALLGLSGWFIAAAAVAGLAGAGLVFDVFAPAAAVRLLALGRTAARYGERLTTHDATLRALAALRVDLLRRQARAGWEALTRLRGEAALTRITADVDALDGLLLRLAIPAAAGALTLAMAFGLLAWLASVAVAAAICLGLGLGGALVLARAGRAALAPSARAEAASQRLRRELVDLGRGRRELVVFGGMDAARARVLATEAEARAALAALDRTERAAGLALSILSAAVAAAALAIGGALAAQGTLSAPLAALGFFAALALAETLAPLRRGAMELGRIRDAAGRVMAAPDAGATSPAATAGAEVATPAAIQGAPALELRDLRLRRPGAARAVLDGVGLAVHAGETVALVGPSGVGKSTLLAVAAGLVAPDAGTVLRDGHPLAARSEADLRAGLMLLPQRGALVAGTVRENLALARDDLADAEARAALEAVALWEALAPRGGLSTRLGEGGAGLSGGEARRLMLARALLRRPTLMLLDEPTEGLDPAAARRVLTGVRAALPGAALLLASHRAVERDFADRVHVLT